MQIFRTRQSSLIYTFMFHLLNMNVNDAISNTEKVRSGHTVHYADFMIFHNFRGEYIIQNKDINKKHNEDLLDELSEICIGMSSDAETLMTAEYYE